MLTKHFFESTRGRIVALLRERESTVDELSTRLQLTGNAVRAHVTAMEREGVVRRIAQRPGATRPSHVFALTTEIEHLLSRAYLPLMTQFVHVCTTALTAGQVEQLMRDAGRGLARELTRGLSAAGRLPARISAASDLMNEELGAITHVEHVEKNKRYKIQGVACPLSALTGKHPSVCLAVASFLSAVTRARVRECCDREGKPRCCFDVKNA
jgi:predicted ArsR family transcriptional regulator